MTYLYRTVLSYLFAVGFTLIALVHGLPWVEALAASPAAPLLPSPDALAPADYAQALLQFVQEKNGWGLASIGLVALVWLSRKIPAHTKVGSWLHTRLGGWITNFALSAGVGLFTLALSKTAMTPAAILGLLISAVGVSFGAAGVVELGKDIFGKPPDSTGAKAAGLAAVADPGKVLGQ